MKKPTDLYITFTDDLCVIASDETDDIFKAVGFESVADCWEFARNYAKGCGLSEENIFADVSEVK